MKAYEKKNPPTWLEDERLREIYAATTGPYDSPDPVECFILWSAARKAGGPILEIGSWHGRSSCFLADAASSVLHCIDWWKGDQTGGANPSRKAMEDSLRLLGLTDRVVIHDADMTAFDYAVLPQAKMCFYDSDHSTAPTVSALTAASVCIEPGAPVFMHDASWQSTQAAIDQLCRLGLYERDDYYNVWEGLAKLRRLP